MGKTAYAVTTKGPTLQVLMPLRQTRASRFAPALMVLAGLLLAPDLSHAADASSSPTGQVLTTECPS